MGLLKYIELENEHINPPEDIRDAMEKPMIPERNKRVLILEE